MDDLEALKLVQDIDQGNNLSEREKIILREVKELDLANSTITSLPDSIGQLTALVSLNLTESQIIYLPESIGQLTALQSLLLRSTRITALPESIGRLSALQSLDLCGTNISALPESIGQLSSLQSLNLRGTNINALPESIGNLRSLQNLDLCGTNISALPESIGQLCALRSLNISGTKITSLPESIGQLTSLQNLDANKSRITSLPPSIGALSKLLRLDISFTSISYLPDTIGQLKHLSTLDLSQSAISSLPESIGQISDLSKLRLRNSRLSTLPESIGALKHLTELNVIDTQICRFPKTIGNLTSLTQLYAKGCKISEIPDSFRGLTSLKTLYLRETCISELPSALKELHSLSKLFLGYTKIKQLPDWMGENPNLSVIELSGLTLRSIPKSLACKGLQFYERSGISNDAGVNLYETEILNQPKNVFLESPTLIPDLFHDLITMRECKIIFLGDGGAGKSYTIQRLLNEGKKETADQPIMTHETPGVEILPYHVASGRDSFDIHFWDFGGQQILHSMHRCFLTEQTCYVVMVKTRETKATQRARYWLRNVQAFAPNSPVLLYVNCWENDDGMRSVDEPRLLKEFPKLQKIVYCSSMNAENRAFQSKFMEPLFEMAATSDGCSREVNSHWDFLRKAIQRENRCYLTKERYHDLCEENGVPDENAVGLLTFFNNIGVCFSYHRDLEKTDLADYKLLDPVWLTNAIYAIIEEGMTFAQQGKIPIASIQELLGRRSPDSVRGRPYQRTKPEFIYNPEECQYVLDVAAAHELCYRIDRETVFFPALLSNNSPDDAMNSVENYAKHLEYRLKYDYLPDSVVHQLMISCLRDHFSVGNCWLCGMVMHVANLQKLVVRMLENDEAMVIDIYSSEKLPVYNLFIQIREKISAINQRLNLKMKEFIVRGEDVFALPTLLGAMKGTGVVYGPSSGEEYLAKDLLGDAYDPYMVPLIHVKNGQLLIPILPRKYHECPQGNDALRYALYIAYNQNCPYCGRPIQDIRDMQVDHIFPQKYEELPELKDYVEYLRSRGFNTNKPDYIENYLPTHVHCNGAAGKSNSIDPLVLAFSHQLAGKKAHMVLNLMEQYNKRKKL